jgi:hypothetical protein
MLFQKTRKTSAKHDPEIGKELIAILFDKNGYLRFVGKNKETSFGIIVECHETTPSSKLEIIVCVPKPFLENFMSLSKQYRDVRKLVTKKSLFNYLLKPFSSKHVPSVDFEEDFSDIKIVNIPQQSLPDDPYGFLRIKISKDIKLSVCEKFAILTEKPSRFPLFLTHLADNFPKSKNKVFFTDNFIKSTDIKTFVISASGGISPNSLGSPVFDHQGLHYGMIVEMLNNNHARCVTMQRIFASFDALYKVTLT